MWFANTKKQFPSDFRESVNAPKLHTNSGIQLKLGKMPRLGLAESNPKPLLIKRNMSRVPITCSNCNVMLHSPR